MSKPIGVDHTAHAKAEAAKNVAFLGLTGELRRCYEQAFVVGAMAAVRMMRHGGDS